MDRRKSLISWATLTQHFHVLTSRAPSPCPLGFTGFITTSIISHHCPLIDTTSLSLSPGWRCRGGEVGAEIYNLIINISSPSSSFYLLLRNLFSVLQLTVPICSPSAVCKVSLSPHSHQHLQLL